MFKILVTHHPFLPPPHKPAGKILLGRARQALPALESCGVDLLLAGHYHRCFSGDITEQHSHLERPMLVAHAATATSTRLRNEPNGYNLITIAPPAVTFEERTWSGGRFAAADRSTFIRTPHRWSPAPR